MKANGSDELKTIERVVNVVNQVLRNSQYNDRRCMATSALVRHFLERLGFTAALWTGSVDYLSRKGVRLVEDGVFDLEERNITPARVQQIRKYEARGLRVISCRVNERPDKNDLGGHVCVVAEANGHRFFIDGACGQFAKDDRGAGAKHEVSVPARFIAQINTATGAYRVVHHVKRKTYGLYKAGRIDALAEPRFEIPDGDHDLNPRRVPTIYHQIAAALALEKG